MANRIFLVCNDSPISAGPLERGLRSYSNSDIVMESSSFLPILWQALFRPKDIKKHQTGSLTTPTIIAVTQTSKTLLQKRKKLFSQAFSKSMKDWNYFWDRAINKLKYKYLKVDLFEQFNDIEANRQQRDLKSALRWFSSRSKPDFAPVLRLAGIPVYKPKTKKQIQDAERMREIWYEAAQLREHKSKRFVEKWIETELRKSRIKITLVGEADAGYIENEHDFTVGPFDEREVHLTGYEP